MTDITNPVEQVRDKLASLEVFISKSSNDVLTAFTRSEPLFCFDSTSFEELDAQVSNALRSYARVFYGVEINLKPRDGGHPLPVERLTPFDTFVPELEAA